MSGEYRPIAEIPKTLPCPHLYNWLAGIKATWVGCAKLDKNLDKALFDRNTR
jgi:hypothetical protein